MESLNFVQNFSYLTFLVSTWPGEGYNNTMSSTNNSRNDLDETVRSGDLVNIFLGFFSVQYSGSEKQALTYTDTSLE